MKIVPNLDFVALLPTQPSLSNFLEMLRKVYRNLATTFNGSIGFGDGTNFDNISGTWANTTAPAAPNTDFTITHNLGRVPVGYWVMQKDRACDVYTGSIAATTTQLTLRATVASAVLRLFIVGILLFFASTVQAQTTTVTLQVTDVGGQAWNLGTWAVVLVSKQGAVPFGPPFNIPGSGPVPNQFQTGNFDATGTATMVLTQNSAIVPTQSQWRFTVCPQATSPCFDQAFVIANATQSVSPTPPAISVSCGAATKAYTDSEVLCQQGGFYYGLTLNQIRLCISSVLPNTCLTWVGSAGTAAAGGIPIQTQVNNANLIAGTPCESFSNLTLGPENVDCDLHSKGPNPNVDITRFGARTCNQNITPCASGITASINNGSVTATISSASTFINGDGIVVYGAGPSQSMTTPTAPTVTNVLAQTGTGTGLTNPSAAGSSTRCYKIIARDTGGGFTAASSETCSTTGQATLGVITINLTSCSRSGTTVTCTTAAATPLLVGGGGSALGEVYIGGGAGTIDNTFRGFHEVGSVADSTHFTYIDSAVNTLQGAPTSTTGGTATFYAANHLTWPAVTGAWLYYIYGGASGAETLIGVSRPNQTVNGNLDTTFEDFGSLMSNYTFPPFIPTTPPASPANDNLSTTIVSGAGTTTLTLFNAAGATVSGAGIRLDAGVGIAKAAAASSNVSPLYIPNDPSGNPFVVNNFCDLRTFQLAIYQSGSLWLNETLAVGQNSAPIGTFRWTGGQNTAFGLNGGGSGWGPAPPVYVFEATPGVYDGGGDQITVSGVQFLYKGTNGALLFFVDGTGGAFNNQFSNGIFATGTTAGDLMGFGLYMRNMSGVFFDRMGIGSGNSADGTSHNTPFFCNSCGDIHMTSVFTKSRGYIVVVGSSGSFFGIDSDHYNGGGTPLISVHGSSISIVLGAGVIMDTVGHPCVAMLASAKGSVTNNGCAPSGSNFASPAVTGSVQFLDRGGGPPNLTNSLLTNQIAPGLRESDNTAVVDQQLTGPGAITVSSLDSVIVNNVVPATPTCLVSAGGSIAIGTWTFIMQPVWQNGQEGVPSAASSGCTTTTGNQTITVNWTALGGNPTLYRIFVSNGGGFGLQVNASPTTTSTVLTTIGVGTPLNFAPLGGPTMLMPGIQGIAAPTMILTGNSLTGIAPGSVIATSYQNSVYDNFNQAGSALSTNWTPVTGTTTPTVTGNQVVGNTAATRQAAAWTATTFSGSQFAQITAPVGGSSASGAISPTCLSATSTWSYYQFQFFNGNFSLGRRVSGTFAQLGSNVPGTLSNGDVLRIECVVLSPTSVLVTGFQTTGGVRTQIIQQTDSSANFTSGSPGFDVFGNVSQSVIDNWSGGNLHPVAQLDTEQDWTQPQHFTQPVTIGPTNPVAGALVPNALYVNPLISQSANPASVGLARLATGDFLAWRNNANTADAQIGKSTAANGNIPVDTFGIGVNGGQQSGIQSNFFISNNSAAAATAIFRLGSSESIAWRNNANNADVLLNKNTSDQLVYNASIVALGTLQSVNSTTTTCPTGAAAGSTCTFTVTWPTAFVDTAYTPSCIGGGTITGFPFIQGFSSKTTTALTVVVVNGTSNEAVASGYSEMDCIGRHP